MAYPADADVDAEIGGGSIPGAADAMNSAPAHSLIHRLLGDAVQAVEAKVGIGSTVPAAGKILAGVSGGSEWTATPSGLTSLTATSVVGALTGNATTATTLANPRTIGGVSFNGGANIDLPGVNTAGNQATSGLAATATLATLATTITVADAGSDTTLFPLLATDGTGSELVYADASALTYNAATGALGATTFVGALTGVASSAAELSATWAAETLDIHQGAVLAVDGVTYRVIDLGKITIVIFESTLAVSTSSTADVIIQSIPTAASASGIFGSGTLSTTAYGINYSFTIEGVSTTTAKLLVDGDASYYNLPLQDNDRIQGHMIIETS
jgi:hypothetical protein